MSEIGTEQWFQSLVEDCKDIVTETEFTHNWSLVEGRHQLGSRILQEYENFQRLRMPDSELVQRIAISINRRKRTVYYSIQFARMYPDLNLLLEGKNISWSHIINKYLTPESDKPKRPTVTILLDMLKEIKKLLDTEWLKAHQQVIAGNIFYPYPELCGFIRYLQDQVNKITGDLEL